MNDLDLIARPDAMLRMQRARDDCAVDFDSHRPFTEAEVIDETENRDLVGHVLRRAVDGDPHGHKLTSP
jgi:hypothetical protein